LRSFFKVDRHHIVVAALAELARHGDLDQAMVEKAISTYGIDPDAAHPLTR
jgi:pyruvate dehydrogenase E1 component